MAATMRRSHSRRRAGRSRPGARPSGNFAWFACLPPVIGSAPARPRTCASRCIFGAHCAWKTPKPCRRAPFAPCAAYRYARTMLESTSEQAVPKRPRSACRRNRLHALAFALSPRASLPSACGTNHPHHPTRESFRYLQQAARMHANRVAKTQPVALNTAGFNHLNRGLIVSS